MVGTAYQRQSPFISSYVSLFWPDYKKFLIDRVFQLMSVPLGIYTHDLLCHSRDPLTAQPRQLSYARKCS